MNRLLPQPLMSVALLAAWLLANNSVAPGHLVLGACLALVIPIMTQSFWPEYPRTVRYGRLLRFIAIVLYDIVVANLTVAAIIINPFRSVRPGFIVIPLDLRHPFAITLLASTISLTPGTVSANLSGDRRTLLVHGFDIADEDAAVAAIKDRYERRIREIFE